MKFKVIRNDISNMEVDAIVLPANPGLKIGSGTSKAIFDKAGRKELEKACKKIGQVKPGHTVVTGAYALDASFIFHSVVPKWIDGEHDELMNLSMAYLSALILADDLQCQSIAFPLLGAGNNGFGLETAYKIARESIECFDAHNRLKDVYLVVYSADVVTMLKNQGMFIEEYIDGIYVLNKDEKHKTAIQVLLERAKDVATLYIEDGKAYAMDYADKVLEALEDPENRKMLEQWAIQCVQEVNLLKMGLFNVEEK